MGYSPQEYLLRIRMKKACELLQVHDLSIRQVGISVGYKDQLLFSRMFKKIVGVSPIHYRKQKEMDD
ncbi:helix-turn-helix transcriptional regulator [Bacillus sp. 03113]|uniref:helix-turn-helix transcriptional regulator n=1 Tax=Bacillus sp. 03113 TaxID=2578211 RepID=UPI00215C611C|nr:helix-turn-helix transcriptional regulator [Bacillus sp. 03113]